LLDESTSALDHQAVVAFYEAIRNRCPDVTVISVMHGTNTPKSTRAGEFFSSVLSVDDGIVTKSSLIQAQMRAVQAAALPG
jgi:vitamin B12/bleomycin/antimicrobial peptide transport system ATP-binding/permease protein